MLGSFPLNGYRQGFLWENLKVKNIFCSMLNSAKVTLIFKKVNLDCNTLVDGRSFVDTESFRICRMETLIWGWVKKFSSQWKLGYKICQGFIDFFYILSKNNMLMAMIFEIRGCCSCKFTWKKFDMSIKNVMLNLMVMGVVFNPLTLRSNL